MLTWIQKKDKSKMGIYNVISGACSNVVCRTRVVKSAACLPLMLRGTLQVNMPASV
jgi:hypothetical protein